MTELINDELKDRKNIQLGDIFEVVKNKNRNLEESLVLTNSAVHGIMSQKDFFDDAKITTTENIDKYTVIELGNFVYNPRKSVTAPYGPVNINEYSKGVISPLYFCFKLKEQFEDRINKKYIHQFFQSNAWYKYVYMNGDTGTRHDRVSISNDTFMKMPISLHNFEEQNKIVELLSSIDDLINMQTSIKELKQLELEYLKKQLATTNSSQQLNLSSLIKIYNERNSLDDTIPVAIGRYGIRLRSEIYSNELSKDLSKNKVIFKDTITFGMGSSQIDYGILTDDTRYCVSPAYHTYKIQTDIIQPKYLKYLFDNDIRRLSKLYMITSARQGKSVDFDGLLNHYFAFPDMETQIKHVELLSNIEELINNSDKLIEQYKELKKHYLNLIFK